MAAETPVAEKIFDELVRRLRLIATASGYWFDVEEKNVERVFALSVVENIPLPSILVVHGEIEDDNPQGGSIGSTQVALRVQIVFLASDASDTQPTTARRMKADITKAVGDEFEVTDADGRSGLITPERLTTELGVVDGDASVVFASVVYDILYEHKHGDEARFGGA